MSAVIEQNKLPKSCSSDRAEPVQLHRSIRSYVRRDGRLTRAQQYAMDTLWPIYGIELSSASLKFADIFGRTAPVTLEIGFGDGVSLSDMAARMPERNFVGIEVYRPGVGRLLHEIEKKGVTNVRIICEDAITVLQEHIADTLLNQVLLLFPDPWPKRRHHKRRIVQPDFVTLVARKLRQQGIFHIATDWQAYADHISFVMAQSAPFDTAQAQTWEMTETLLRPHTKYELRGRRLGHTIWDLIYRKI